MIYILVIHQRVPQGAEPHVARSIVIIMPIDTTARGIYNEGEGGEEERERA